MDNKTFLETIVRYLSPGKLGIRIYHQSSPYFYKYPLNQDYSNTFYYFFYKRKWADFSSLDLSYHLGPSTSFEHYLAEPYVLNDFCSFKLKLYPSVWSDETIHVLYAYRKEDLAADTIKSAWKKYRWNYRRNKMDPLKRELVAWVYHPKRLKFTID